MTVEKTTKKDVRLARLIVATLVLMSIASFVAAWELAEHGNDASTPWNLLLYILMVVQIIMGLSWTWGAHQIWSDSDSFMVTVDKAEDSR